MGPGSLAGRLPLSRADVRYKVLLLQRCEEGADPVLSLLPGVFVHGLSMPDMLPCRTKGEEATQEDGTHRRHHRSGKGRIRPHVRRFDARYGYLPRMAKYANGETVVYTSNWVPTAASSVGVPYTQTAAILCTGAGTLVATMLGTVGLDAAAGAASLNIPMAVNQVLPLCVTGIKSTSTGSYVAFYGDA